MPERNRVTPSGEVVASPLRGAWMGNRGILHRGAEVVRFHASDLWITCALEFRGWRAAQWEPGHYTVLFFHDEAVALAAGHRPCALCRRKDYDRFRDALGGVRPSARELDRSLHGQRIVRGTHRRRTHATPWADLPDGAFVVGDGAPLLVRGDALVPWDLTSGYGAARRRPRSGQAQMLTPPLSATALRAGYVPQVDPGAL